MLTPKDLYSSLADSPLEGRLQLNAENCAAHIELLCGDYLLPPPEGVYIMNRLEPVIKAGNTYYTRTDNAMGRKKVDDLNTVSQAVYDQFDKQVVPKLFMLNKARYLSNHSFLPYRGLKIVEILADEQLGSFLRYRKHRPSYTDKLVSQLVPSLHESQHEELFTNLDNAYRDISRDIMLFLKDDAMHLHYLKLDQNQLVIEKAGDLRIIQWESEHGHEYRA
jgi:hypothetical protein